MLLRFFNMGSTAETKIEGQLSSVFSKVKIKDFYELQFYLPMPYNVEV